MFAPTQQDSDGHDDTNPAKPFNLKIEDLDASAPSDPDLFDTPSVQDEANSKDAGSLLDIDLKRGKIRLANKGSGAEVVSLPPDGVKTPDSASNENTKTDAPPTQSDSIEAPTPMATTTSRSDSDSPGISTPALVLAGVVAILALMLILWLASGLGEPTTAQLETAAQPSSAAPADVPSTVSPAPSEDGENASGDAATSAAVPESGTGSIAPSFDLVRIEADGHAVLAGRAAPNAALILLDNGEILSRVTTNFAGEWAFVTEQPLAKGEHDFALLIDSPQGQVTIPAPKTPASNEPGAASDGASDDSSQDGASVTPTAPLPNRKPEKPDLGSWLGVPGKKPSYEVQLASVSSRDAATSEWKRLQERFPDLLGKQPLMLRTMKQNNGAGRFRVRTGTYSQLEEAREVCQALRSADQDCLVVKQ